MSESHRKKHINKNLLLVVLLVISFFAALTFYFAKSVINTEREGAVYSSMEEPSLPVIYALVDEFFINPMKGYYQDMGNEAADTITPLPEDRQLEIRIRKYGRTIAGLSYEIRNLSLDHFIERTEIGEIEQENDYVTVSLPIQNLIDKDTEYILAITLDIGGEKVNYYTRILWSDSCPACEMLSTAKEFTEKTFNYEAAKDLTGYLETDPKVDNSDLGLVTIGSSFSQLTWGNTGMKLASELQLSLKSCSGIMGAVEVNYRTSMTVPAGEEEFSNIDEFTMRVGSERMYIMNYHRNTYEIFSGSKHRFVGKKIMLGITGKEELSTSESPDGNYVVFKTDRELWCYDQKTQEAVNIFSFRGSDADDIRCRWRDHGIKTLSVSDDGTVDFVVYGYMNRGIHEGYSGLVYYSYSPEDGSTTEKFFAPLARSTEKIGLELAELCSKGGSEMFFFKQNGTVMAVELESLEMMEIVSGLTEGTCLSDQAQTRFAWVDNGKYGSSVVNIMDITSGTTQSMENPDGKSYILLCFSSSDLVLGQADPGDMWMIGKRVRSLPLEKILIFDKSLSCILNYEKSGSYIDDFRFDSNRFLFNLYAKAGTVYTKTGSDTIVCAQEDSYSSISRIGTTTSGDKQTVYYVEIEEEIRNTKNLKIQVPDRISHENSGTIEIRAVEEDKEVRFAAWANGHLQGITTSFKTALSLCYEEMGWITDINGAMVYNRTDRTNYCTVRDPLEKAKPLLEAMDNITGNCVTGEGYLLIDAYGTELSQLLGFIYKDHPVVWLDGNGSCILIYGYDAETIKAAYPENGGASYQTKVFSREEAEKEFSKNGGNYLCFTKISN